MGDRLWVPREGFKVYKFLTMYKMYLSLHDLLYMRMSVDKTS